MLDAVCRESARSRTAIARRSSAVARRRLRSASVVAFAAKLSASFAALSQAAAASSCDPRCCNALALRIASSSTDRCNRLISTAIVPDLVAVSSDVEFRRRSGGPTYASRSVGSLERAWGSFLGSSPGTHCLGGSASTFRPSKLHQFGAGQAEPAGQWVAGQSPATRWWPPIRIRQMVLHSQPPADRVRGSRRSAHRHELSDQPHDSWHPESPEYRCRRFRTCRLFPHCPEHQGSR